MEDLTILDENGKALNIPVVSGSTCWIMHRTTDDLIFVTTDEEYAKRQYESGDYVMRQSTIFDPL
jgi:hypothetical protein